MSVSISPHRPIVVVGGSVNLEATVSNATNRAVTWSIVEGASGGAITASGVYTAPANAGTYHVTATSQADANKSDTIDVDVHTISPCPAAGATPLGAWQNVTPPGTDMQKHNGQTVYGTQGVLVNPQETSIVYVGVDRQGLFRSSDCGATWAHINTGRNGDVVGTGAQWSMVMDPGHPDTIYAINGYGSTMGLWKTIDGGVDWDQLLPQGSAVVNVAGAFASIVSMDPTDAQHLVVSFHGPCSGTYAPTCLAETTNGGADWNIVKTDYRKKTGEAVTNYEGAGVMVIDKTTWVVGFPSDGLYATTNGGATWSNVTPNGVNGTGWQMYHSPITHLHYIGSSPGSVSSPDGVTWTLLSNAGAGTSMVGTGQTLVTSVQYGGAFYSGNEALGNGWAPLAHPDNPLQRGAYFLAYDSDHQFLFATEQEGGLWRVGIQ